MIQIFLPAKLTEMGQLEQVDAGEEVGIEEQKRKKQMKVIEELIMTETNYCSDISQLLATMQSLEDLVSYSKENPFFPILQSNVNDSFYLNSEI